MRTRLLEAAVRYGITTRAGKRTTGPSLPHWRHRRQLPHRWLGFSGCTAYSLSGQEPNSTGGFARTPSSASRGASTPRGRKGKGCDTTAGWL